MKKLKLDRCNYIYLNILIILCWFSLRTEILYTFIERGRTRRKRRDFFGTIKKRLSRSKTRSRSVGPDGDTNHEDAHSRSISADRARDPGSGKFLALLLFHFFLYFK